MRALLIAAMFSAVSTALAKDGEYPDTFVQLIEPDAQIGVRRNPETGMMSVVIYSDDVFDVLRDAETMTAEELDEKYPHVAEAKQREIARFKAERESSGDSLLPVDAPLMASVHAYRGSRLYTVIYVGSDHFVAAGVGESAGRIAFPMRHVSSVGWENEVPISVTVRRRNSR